MVAGRGKPIKSEIAVMGRNLIALGKALQDPCAKVGVINRLASACGLRFDVKFVNPPKADKKPDATAVPSAVEVVHDAIQTAEDQLATWFRTEAAALTDGVPQAFSSLVRMRFILELNRNSGTLNDRSPSADIEGAYCMILAEVRTYCDELLEAIAAYDKGKTADG